MIEFDNDNEVILNAITSFIPQRDPLLEYPVCALVTKCAVLFSSFNSQDLIVNSCLQLLCKPRKLHVVRGIWF